MEEIEDNFVQLAAKRAKEVGSLGSLDPEVSIKYQTWPEVRIRS